MARTVEDLNPREVVFAEYYGLVGSETYSNASASAKRAGYADPTGRTVGWKLLKREAVRAKIQQVHAAQMSRLYLTADKVLSDIEDQRIKADKKGDIAGALRASELQGKYLALFVDRQSFETPEQRRELDAREAEECRQIALIRLKMQISGELSPGFHPALQAGNEAGKSLDGEGVSPPNQEK